MNIPNPIVLVLLPTALETKSKFLGKACKALHGLVPSTFLLPPHPQHPGLPSVTQKYAQAGQGMLLPTHFCLLLIPDSGQGSLVFPDTLPPLPTQRPGTGSLL